jgi:hypothetical protein
MNKYVVLGFFFLVFLVGLVAILVNNSISFGDFMRGLGRMNPRVASLLILPFVAVAFVVGVRLHKKREDRLWKQAMKDTRKKRQS